MQFEGTVYFDFESGDSWRLFRLIATAAQEGATVSTSWVGFPAELPQSPDAMTPGQRALAAHAAIVEPSRQLRLRQALFTLVHLQGDSLDEELTYRAAAKVAGVDGDVLLDAIQDVGYRTMIADRERGTARGVIGTPSIARQGPPLRVTTTPAVETGRASPRLTLIDHMLDDDGLWGLVKP